MKTYNKHTSNNASAYWIMVCFLGALIAAVIPGFGQVIKPFAARTSPSIYRIKGDFTMIGNSNLTLQTYGDNTNNSNNVMIFTDVDGDPNTFNSSSATLAFSTENGATPACSNILFAGLYWTGRSDLNGDVFDVTKTVPGGSTPYDVTTAAITNGTSITNTPYTMAISRQGTDPYYVRYTFTGGGGDPVVDFEFQNASPYIRYRVNGGAWQQPTNQVFNDNVDGGSNNSERQVTFDPVTIWDGTDLDLTIDRLQRDDRTNRSEAQYQADSEARVRVNGTVPGTTTITKSFDKKVFKIKGPGDASYTTWPAVPSTSIYYPTTTEGGMFAGYADVTEFVRTRGLGEYTVADLALVEGNGGSTGFYGGWSMVVVYENSKMNWRDVTLFDGYAYVIGGTAQHELPISGFQAVQNGQVNIKVGVMAGEGDVGISGDYFEIRNAANTDWVRLSHSGNSTGNFFNGSVQTGGNARNPSIQNNTGLDVAMWNLPNAGNSLIANSQTSTTFRYGSTQDTYIIFNLAFSVDAYIPDVQNALASISPLPASVLPGEEYEFKVDIRNLGTEAVNNYKLQIPLPANVTFDPTTLSKSFTYTPAPTNSLYFDPLLGSTGTIVFDYGTLPLSSSVGKITTDILSTITFKLKATENCYVLRVPADCRPGIVLQGTSTGVGAISGTSFSGLPFVTGFGTGVCATTVSTAPLYATIDADAYLLANCTNTGEEILNGSYVFNNCPAQPSTIVDFNSIASKFPTNTQFYRDFNGQKVYYTASNSFPSLLGDIVYYAVPPGEGVCPVPFIIRSCEIPQTISGVLWVDKNGDFAMQSNEAHSQIPLPDTYQVFAVVTNDSHNSNKLLKRVTVAAGDGTYNFTIPANPVLNASNVAVNPVYSLVLHRGTDDPSSGGTIPTPPSSVAGMGTAAVTASEYYGTAPAVPGNYNASGILAGLEIASPWTPIVKNVGMQSRPNSGDVEAILSGTISGKTFIPLEFYPLFAVDAEDGPLQNGRDFRILTLPQPKVIGGKTVVIKLAYDKDGDGPTEADVIETLPAGGHLITGFNPAWLYAYYVSGDANSLYDYGEFFQYTGIDAANVGSTSNIPYSGANQVGGSDQPLGTGTDGAAVYTLSGGIVLPSTGLQLAGSYNAGKAALKWSLKGTDDVVKYELERGNSANVFRVVASLAANGREYSHTDDLSAFAGSDAFYRVKMLRSNGTTVYSNIISLKLATISGLQIMPTIVQSNLQVRFYNARSQDVTIRVLSITGQSVMVQTSKLPAGNASINLMGFEKLTNGTYSVQVFSGTNVTQGKIVVQH